MAVSSKGIGGNEVPLDANEAIADIPQNRTLIAQKLTADDPIKPELVEGLTTVKAALEDPEAKAALLSTLQGLIGELEEKK